MYQSGDLIGEPLMIFGNPAFKKLNSVFGVLLSLSLLLPATAEARVSGVGWQQVK